MKFILFSIHQAFLLCLVEIRISSFRHTPLPWLSAIHDVVECPQYIRSPIQLTDPELLVRSRHVGNELRCRMLSSHHSGILGSHDGSILGINFGFCTAGPVNGFRSLGSRLRTLVVSCGLIGSGIRVVGLWEMSGQQYNG